MSEQAGFLVEPAALDAYHGTADDLAARLAASGPDAAVPGDCFGRIGREVGLHAAFEAAVRAERDGLAAVGTALAGLAAAVRRANVDYAEQDADTAAAITRAGEVPS